MFFKFFTFLPPAENLGDDDVRSGDKEGGSGEHREPGEGDQAEPVEHHGRELPVVFYGGGVFVIPQLVCNHLLL